METPFVHLHTHSYYSLLNALPSVEALVARAKEQGATALALTDDAALYGAVPFIRACQAQEIKPIIGLDAYIAPNGRHQKRARIDKKAWRLVLLAKDTSGYKNLLKLSSLSYLEGFYYTPRIDDELLSGDLGKGLIGLSGGLSGEISTHLQNGDRDKAESAAKRYEGIFGKGNFYIEVIYRPDSGEQVAVNGQLIELARDLDIPLVATSNSYYLNPDDHEGWEAMLCIKKGQTLEEYRRMSGIDVDLSLAHPDKIAKEFAAVEDALANTVKIADMCNVEVDLGNNYLPVFEVPKGKTDSAYLKEWCERGLKERYGELTPEIQERFDFEFSTIDRMGFASYFLIVADFVKYAKDKGILVGPGRGSAAGSIVSYALGVTDVDPIKYGLLFERFLNPDRISMPDIDLDFADSRRGEVLEYVRDRYGADHVAGIITFGKMMPKAAVRDAARVLGLDFQTSDVIAKMVPNPVQGRHTPLEVAIKEHKELRDGYNADPNVTRVVNLAMKIEGAPRHTSQHACGVVISDKPLTDYVPIQESQHEDLDYVSQYSLGPVEDAGLVKMDFLGLSNLTIIESALEIIKAVHDVDVDIEHVPLDDKETFALLGRGETVGVFQLESEGMRRYLVELKPTEFEDIMAMCALYRPGPLSAGMVPMYINRKHGREKVTYDDPRVKEILEETYGVTIFQEQIMQISRTLAGFTGGQADTLRKAMGKKKHDVLAKMKKDFVDGCVRNKVTSKTAQKIWTDWEGFADYAFNKSHTACYGMIAYQTAYLKAHYPAEFMAAVMNSDAGNIDRMTIEVQECKRMGIEVLPPDINESFKGFGVVPGKKQIRWGLVAIKNVGEEIAESIVEERKANGPYKDLTDVVTRIKSKNFNRKSIEALIMTGAFDAFAERGLLMANLDTILRFHKQMQKDAESQQGSLFALAPEMDVNTLKLKESEPAARSERLAWERELLGIYVSEHPFMAFADTLAEYVRPTSAVQEGEDRASIIVAGVVVAVRQILTKKGDPMAFARIEDSSGDVEVVFFPKTFAEYRPFVAEGELMVITGKVSVREGQNKSVLADSLACFDESNIDGVVQMFKDGMWVDERTHANSQPKDDVEGVSDRSVLIGLDGAPTEKQIAELRELFTKKPGDVPVEFAVESAGRVKAIRTDFSITPTNAVVDAIRKIVGSGSVKVVESSKVR